MNSIMERWVQTCRHELLDRTLIWNQQHLLHVLREFEQFDNGHRPHQASRTHARCTRCPRTVGQRTIGPPIEVGLPISANECTLRRPPPEAPKNRVRP